jgi:hypothetical protein
MHTHIHIHHLMFDNKERHGLNKCPMNKLYKVCSLPVHKDTIACGGQNRHKGIPISHHSITSHCEHRRRYSFTHRQSITQAFWSLVQLAKNRPKVQLIKLIARKDKCQFTWSQNKKCQASWFSRSHKWKWTNWPDITYQRATYISYHALPRKEKNTDRSSQMNWLSLRINQLKFKASGTWTSPMLSIILVMNHKNQKWYYPAKGRSLSSSWQPTDSDHHEKLSRNSSRAAELFRTLRRRNTGPYGGTTLAIYSEGKFQHNTRKIVCNLPVPSLRIPALKAKFGD